jgi:hypothetical protein
VKESPSASPSAGSTIETGTATQKLCG